MRVGNGKQRPQPKNYNNIPKQNPNPHQKGTDLREIKKKSNNIFISNWQHAKDVAHGWVQTVFAKRKSLPQIFSKKQNNLTITLL